jgi:hypothetical protein
VQAPLIEAETADSQRVEADVVAPMAAPVAAAEPPATQAAQAPAPVVEIEAPAPRAVAPMQPIIADVVPAPQAAVADAIEAANTVEIDAAELPAQAALPTHVAATETPSADAAKQSGA